MTTPATQQNQIAAGPHIVIAPTYEDPTTKALYVHTDLQKVRDDYVTEAHIGPIKESQAFGDVESWAAYVTKYGDKDALVTWNSEKLRAVLDYHEADGTADRCQWTATHPFERSREWVKWSVLASGRAVTQREIIEALEDMAEDIVDPPAVDLMGILRNLRANVSATANTELRPDGSTAVAFSQDKRIAGGANNLTLPPEIAIAIPVLRGHVGTDGKPVRYKLTVRIRVSIDDSAHLAFRLSIPTAERVLDECIAERVAQAKAALGSEFTVLRATG